MMSDQTRERLRRMTNAERLQLTLSMIREATPDLLRGAPDRPRDFADIGDVLFTQGALDVTHMRFWAGQLGVLQKLEHVLEEPPPIWYGARLAIKIDLEKRLPVCLVVPFQPA